MENQTAIFVEQKFDANVDDVLIRPLGHAFSAQLYVVLYQNLTLKEANKILTKKINAVVSEWFGMEETTVIHLARRGLYRQTDRQTDR
jgi:divalent metal cation (Fe/Co/Zn/Cd) transporter